MAIERIVDYVLYAPHGTNKAISIAMLKQLIKDDGCSGNFSGSSGSDNIICDSGVET